MKFYIISALSFFLLFSCSTPDWKKRGFENKSEYEAHLSDSIFQLHWLHDEDKFIGVYTKIVKGGFSTYEYEQTFTMEILEDGFGKFNEKQYSVDKGYDTFWDDDTFKWKKIDGETILITGLYGKWNYDEYRFKRYNGKYTLSKRTDIKSSNVSGYHKIKNLNTGDSFDRTNLYKYNYNLNQGPIKKNVVKEVKKEVKEEVKEEVSQQVTQKFIEEDKKFYGEFERLIVEAKNFHNQESNHEYIRLAIINDADGYTNVRSEPNSKSTILFKITDEVEFQVINPSKESSWWIVCHNDNYGFMHKSRIDIIDGI